MANKYFVGFLILVVLTSSIYIMLPGNVKIDITKTRSLFYVWENEGWVLSGIEYVNLFDGTAKMRAKNRSLDFVIVNNFTTVTRIANYKDGISTIEIYTFDGNTKDRELFPVNHEVRILNGEGKLFQYEIQKLLYTEETVWDILSPQSFGHSMKIEWEDGNYYSRIYKYVNKDEGKLTVKYRVDSNDFTKDVRLFDPVSVPNVVYDPETPVNETWLNTDSIYAGVEISNCSAFSNVTYQLNGEGITL